MPFTYSQEQEIIRLYTEDFWFKKDIAKHFQCSTTTLNKVFKKYNIPTRTRAINHSLKEDFFENIDTEEKAYILGILFTDGSIKAEANRQDQIRLELQIRDIELINRIKQELGINGKTTFSKHKNKSGSTTESALITINSDKMAQDLAKYGIIPNKTYYTKHLPKLEEKFIPHFFRGLIDGDGSIYTTKTYNEKYQKYYYKKVIYFCSYHQSVCEDFRQMIAPFLSRKELPKVTKEKYTYRFSISKQQDVKEMATLLYKDSNIYLSRKYELARQIFEGNDEEDIVYSEKNISKDTVEKD